MKKLFLFASAIMVWSCSSNEPNLTNVTKNTALVAGDVITPGEATDIAIEAYGDFFKEKSRSGVTVDKNIIAVSSQSFRVSRSGADTVLYIVNFKDDMGFAIVNALRQGDALIGISDQGNYNNVNHDENPPGLEMFLDECQRLSANTVAKVSVIDSPRDGYERLDIMTDTLINDVVEPKVSTKWSQNFFYGQYCPNGITGCAPLALGMALSAFKQPYYIDLTFPGAPYSKMYIQWDNIIVLNPRLSMMDNEHVEQNVALLLRELGHLMNADYSKPEATYIYNLSFCADAAKSVGLTCGLKVSEVDDNLSSVPAYTPDIKKGVVIMKGRDEEKEIQHAWILDGYIYEKIRDTYIITRADGTREIDDIVEWTHYYVHINWGWGGRSNGYFNLSYNNNKISTTNPHKLDYIFSGKEDYVFNDKFGKFVLYQ